MSTEILSTEIFSTEMMSTEILSTEKCDFKNDSICQKLISNN